MTKMTGHIRHLLDLQATALALPRLKVTSLLLDQTSSEEIGGETLEEEGIEVEVQVVVAGEATTNLEMDTLFLLRSTRTLKPLDRPAARGTLTQFFLLARCLLFLSLDSLFPDGHNPRLANKVVLLRYRYRLQAGLDQPKVKVRHMMPEHLSIPLSLQL
jgi:hypothetical protein